MSDLKQTMEYFIAQNGGRIKLAAMLELESFRTVKQVRGLNAGAHIHWTDDDLKYLDHALNEGMYIEDIANILGRTRAGIYEKLRRMTGINTLEGLKIKSKT